ncbi:MAG: hypothetical protein ABIQ16_13775, partial [Polyangiaceae bacterium]
MRRCCLLGFGLGMTAWPGPAHADLAADVRALSSARSEYGPVLRLKPRLVERGERVPLPIPPKFLDPKVPGCATLSLLGVAGLHFAVRFSELDPGAPSTAFAEASISGASEVTRCGNGKPYLAGVVVEMRSPRGVVEALISNAPGVVPKLAELMPSRDPGLELPLGDPGPRPVLAPLAERLQLLAARARREAAQSERIEHWQAGDEGTGAGPLLLDVGCHELSLLADSAPAPNPVVDLDLELVDAESGVRLGVDRAEDADGSLSVCLGAPVRAELRFVGSPPKAELSLVHVRFDLPLGLPGGWGPEARARMAKLALSARLSPKKQPIYSSLGVQGTTTLPLEVEPGVCYSALLVPLRGEVRSLSLSARARAAGEVPRGAADGEGSAVAFCA